jgi:hypothetical protein
MSENKKSQCSTSINCYTVTALCVSFLTLGLLIGNWVGNCQKATKCNKIKKYQSYSVDGKAGSTCNWSKQKKECQKDSLIK